MECTRGPNDGKPYYCAFCGAGFREYLACEAVTCELEPIAKAIGRRRRWLKSIKARKGTHYKKRDSCT